MVSNILLSGDEMTKIQEETKEMLLLLREAHNALMHYEWYANPKSGWARDEHASLSAKISNVLAKHEDQE